MKKIAIVVGTRPEGIKLAPIVTTMRRHFSDQLAPLVIVTGQHEAILHDVLSFFDIHPQVVLTVNRTNPTLSALQSQLMQSLESALIAASPDVVIVQGDTISALAGAIAGYYQRIPVAHVEAGLRSGNIYEPFPEEANRRIITPLAHWHFTPTPKATAALHSEGVYRNVHEVGNTVIDALMHAQHVGWDRPAHQHPWANHHDVGRPMILVTVHRRENWGGGLQRIMAAIQQLVALRDDLDIVWLVHPNPDIREQVTSTLGQTNHVWIYPPASYSELVQLMQLSTIIVTDSGGIQEEAPSLNKPVLVAREVTERMEGVEAGCAILVGTNTSTIVDTVIDLLQSTDRYARMIHQKNPYGDGTASQKILSIIAQS